MADLIPVLVRFEAEMLASIDAARGDVPRAVFVRRCIEARLGLVSAGVGDVVQEGDFGAARVVARHDPALDVTYGPDPKAVFPEPARVAQEAERRSPKPEGGGSRPSARASEATDDEGGYKVQVGPVERAPGSMLIDKRKGRK